MNNSVGTFILDAKKVEIEASDKIKNISVKLISGTASVKGSDSVRIFGGESVELPLTLDESFLITQNEYLDGFTIDATEGIVHVVTNKV